MTLIVLDGIYILMLNKTTPKFISHYLIALNIFVLGFHRDKYLNTVYYLLKNFHL